MLDVRPATELAPDGVPPEWEAIDSRAEKPQDLDGFFDRQGPTPSSLSEQRTLHRFYLRRQAILWADGGFHAGYSSDISRSGMGLISPVQRFPSDEVRVWLPGRERLDLRVVRCVRLDDRCYSCGTVFVGD